MAYDFHFNDLGSAKNRISFNFGQSWNSDGTAAKFTDIEKAAENLRTAFDKMYKSGSDKQVKKSDSEPASSAKSEAKSDADKLKRTFGRTPEDAKAKNGMTWKQTKDTLNELQDKYLKFLKNIGPMISINKNVIALYNNPKYRPYMRINEDGSVHFDKRAYLNDQILEKSDRAKYQKAIQAYDEFKSEVDQRVAEDQRFLTYKDPNLRVLDPDEPNF